MKKIELVIYIAITIIICSILIFFITKNIIDPTRCGPFKTDEWKNCYEECKMSMPLTLRSFGFNSSEITNVKIEEKCVYFCQEELYRKRLEKGCFKK
jgi:hypothetical protein